MKNHFLAICSLVSLPLLFGSCDSQKTHTPAAPTGKKITLKMSIPKGAKKNLVMEADIDMKISEGSQSMNMAMGMLIGMDVESLELDDTGNNLLEMGFSRMKMSIDGGPQKINYDSAVEGSNPMIAKEIAPLLEETFTMKMNPQGEVLEIGGMDNAPATFKQHIEQTENQMGMVATYPKDPVDNGDTWTHQLKQNQDGMDMVTDATYTLLDHKDGKATIGVSGDVSGDLSGHIFGKFEVDIATGWIISGEIELNAKGGVQTAKVDMDMVMTFEGSDG